MNAPRPSLQFVEAPTTASFPNISWFYDDLAALPAVPFFSLSVSPTLRPTSDTILLDHLDLRLVFNYVPPFTSSSFDVFARVVVVSSSAGTSTPLDATTLFSSAMASLRGDPLSPSTPSTSMFQVFYDELFKLPTVQTTTQSASSTQFTPSQPAESFTLSRSIDLLGLPTTFNPGNDQPESNALYCLCFYPYSSQLALPSWSFSSYTRVYFQNDFTP